MSEEKFHSLLELNQMVRETIECEMPDEYWVEAELSECRELRGHCYMELIQKDERTATPVAKAPAKCWANKWAVIHPYFERTTGQQLHAGMKVLLKVYAQFHEAYGFSWIVTDINPEYTLGDMARKRQEIIRQLKAEGVFDLQKELTLPPFCQHIAVISSQTAAGYGDFCNQLSDNPYGFQFQTQLFPAIMQGEGVEQSIIDALEKIYSLTSSFIPEQSSPTRSLSPLTSKKALGFLNITSVVDIEHLREGVSLQAKTISHEGPLEITHTTLTTLYATTQRSYALGSKTIDAATNVLGGIAGVEEARDTQIIIGRDVKRFLVVDIIGNTHQSVSLATRDESLESLNISSKLLLAEDGIDGGKYKRLIVKPTTQFPHAVHATGCGLDNELEGDIAPLADRFEVVPYSRHLLVTDNHHLRSAIGHKDPQETVDEPFAVNLD